MKEKEEIKEGNKFSLLDGLVLLSGIFAAVAIVYTAYWYVDINEKDEEVVISEMEEPYVLNYNKKDNFCSTVINSIPIDHSKFYSEYEMYGCEPKKIVEGEIITNEGNYKTYKQLYYSTELQAKTFFSYYEYDFDSASVSENVITIIRD